MVCMFACLFDGLFVCLVRPFFMYVCVGLFVWCVFVNVRVCLSVCVYVCAVCLLACVCRFACSSVCLMCALHVYLIV